MASESGSVMLSFVSIHAPRGRSDSFGVFEGSACCVSIHAPRGRSDRPHIPDNPILPSVSIHAPRGRSDARYQAG